MRRSLTILIPISMLVASGCSAPAKTTVTPAAAQYEEWEFVVYRAPVPAQEPVRPVVNISVPGAQEVGVATGQQ